jgi:hypothetical protein
MPKMGEGYIVVSFKYSEHKISKTCTARMPDSQEEWADHPQISAV